jgi:hypothetical protein
LQSNSGAIAREAAVRAVRLSSVVAVIAVAFVVLASSMLLLVTIAVITFAPVRPDDAARQPG